MLAHLPATTPRTKLTSRRKHGAQSGRLPAAAFVQKAAWTGRKFLSRSLLDVPLAAEGRPELGHLLEPAAEALRKHSRGHVSRLGRKWASRVPISPLLWEACWRLCVRITQGVLSQNGDGCRSRNTIVPIFSRACVGHFPQSEIEAGALLSSQSPSE